MSIHGLKAVAIQFLAWAPGLTLMLFLCLRLSLRLIYMGIHGLKAVAIQFLAWAPGFSLMLIADC